ncbi:MAG: alpha/beta hydrolase [Chloroflexi bacterium]|nr:alpha/beta hydrolase [Chloroflexota bacterium]
MIQQLISQTREENKENKMKLNRRSRVNMLILISLATIALVIVLMNNAQKRDEAFDEPYHPFISEEAKQEYLAFYDEHAESWPVDSDTLMVPTSFGETFVRISGPENGQPLVLLAGDSENSLAWIPQIEALSKDYRVYAVDNIYDNGRSVYSRPIEKPEDYVKWLDDLFIELGLENINLVGFSYGGWQAAMYAFEHPERLNKLVLISSHGGVNPRIEVMVRGMTYYLFPTETRVKNYIYWFLPDATANEESKPVVDDMVAATYLSFQTFKRRSFVNPTVFNDEDWQNLAVPTLYMMGENDVMFSAEKATSHLNEVAPDIQTMVTSDAGHDITFIKSDWVNEQILLFFEE